MILPIIVMLLLTIGCSGGKPKPMAEQAKVEPVDPGCEILAMAEPHYRDSLKRMVASCKEAIKCNDSIYCILGLEKVFYLDSIQDMLSKRLLLAQGAFIDPRDEKEYKTIKVGEQIWMAENLNYDADDGKCYFDMPASCDKYGMLYSWNAAMNICPEGWHLPDNAEWDRLYRYVDGTNGTDSPYNSPKAGKYLKSKYGWDDDKNGMDSHGFNALPAGYGYPSGRFLFLGNYAIWWTSSEYTADSAYHRNVYYHYDYAHGLTGNKRDLLGVRCVKD